ncbi:hypothetical protein [Caballeronia insecticola]|uniref:Zinc-ribbon domain-containing protein n=1 Tax=Caballeronia insecticola TaxID=758793 RepID=R4WWB7_9BURK|nr:hypothetical protein [Caballeronia insecticola]BAN22212.1 putative uncharacterized protein [Caballeronia insecticola]
MSIPASVCERLRLTEEAAHFRDRHNGARDANAVMLSRWDCGRGHAWDASLDAAQNVRCLNCAGQRRELETRRLRDLAEARGGALLSPGYVDVATPLEWRCAYGHVWQARADAAPRHWCAECARTVFSRFR